MTTANKITAVSSFAQSAAAFDDKLEKLSSVYVDHSASTHIMKDLNLILKYGNIGAAKKRPSRCLLLIGLSGSGKSTLLRKWAELRGLSDKINEDGHRNLLFVELPSTCSPKNLAQEMLHALGDPAAEKGTEASAKTRVKKLLADQQVKLIIFDEFQHLIDKDNDRIIHKAADFVKSLLNAALCPIVLAGLPEAKVVYDHMNNVQLKRRSFGKAVMRPFDWNIRADQLTFRGILLRYEQALEFPEPSGLRKLEKAEGIHAIAEGVLGRAVDFLTLAAVIAIENGERSLTMERLRLTAERFREEDDPQWSNPFGEPSALPSVLDDDNDGEDEGRTTRMYKAPTALKQADLLRA